MSLKVHDMVVTWKELRQKLELQNKIVYGQINPPKGRKILENKHVECISIVDIMINNEKFFLEYKKNNK